MGFITSNPGVMWGEKDKSLLPAKHLIMEIQVINSACKKKPH